MDVTQLPKLKSMEVDSDGRPKNLPGIYRHKDTHATFITAEGEAGSVQADAMLTERWKDAWERVGDVPNRLELLKIRKEQQIKDATAEALEKGKEAAELKEATKVALQEAKAAV